MSTENASVQTEGLLQPADNDQQNVTGTETPDEQTPKTFTQAELDEKVGKRLAKAERKAQAELAQLRSEIEALKTTPKPTESESDKAPVRGDFASYEEFLRAEALHEARKEVKKHLKEFEQSNEKKAKETTQAKANAEFKARVDGVVDAGRKAYADFDAVINEAVSDELIPTKGPLYEAIMDSDIGEKLVYHLAKNPKEAERIAALSVYGQLRELGKLEDRLSAKKEPRETMEPIAGRTTNTGGLSDNLSMDAWVKARNKQLRESRN